MYFFDLNGNINNYSNSNINNINNINVNNINGNINSQQLHIPNTKNYIPNSYVLVFLINVIFFFCL